MFIKYVRLNMASKDVRPNSIWRSKMDARLAAARTRKLAKRKIKRTHTFREKKKVNKVATVKIPLKTLKSILLRKIS